MVIRHHPEIFLLGWAGQASWGTAPSAICGGLLISGGLGLKSASLFLAS